MPLQADSVFFVSPCSLSVFLVLFLLSSLAFFSFCSLSVFVRLISSETPVSMGTDETHAFATQLREFVAPRRCIIGKLSFSYATLIFILFYKPFSEQSYVSVSLPLYKREVKETLIGGKIFLVSLNN